MLCQSRWSDSHKLLASETLGLLLFHFRCGRCRPMNSRTDRGVGFGVWGSDGAAILEVKSQEVMRGFNRQFSTE